MRHTGMGLRSTGFSLLFKWSLGAVSHAWLACSLLASAGLSTLHAEDVRVPAGELRNATLADIKPHPSGSSNYNEIWSYHLFLDGNVQAYLNISRVNLGAFKAPVCGADLTVLGFKGKSYAVAREYDKSNFLFIDSLAQLQVHKNIWFSGKLPEKHRLFFATRKKDVDYYLDLEFSEIMPGKVWGDGMFKVGSEKVGIFLHIPKAKVTGRLAINGDTVKVSGLAYMDHTYQTALAPELVRGGYRYISHNGDLEVGYYLDPANGYGKLPIGYGLKMQSGSLALLKPASLAAPSTNKALGVKVPTKLEVAFQGGGKSVFDRKDDRFQRSYLHEFSGITKMAIKRFMGGEIMGFKGMGSLNGTAGAGYNYFIVD